MKTGSLYILNDALMRYTGEGDKFELLRVDDNDNIVGKGIYQDFPLVPRILWILWSNPPRIRRTYYTRDSIIVLCNGSYTICPKYAMFATLGGSTVACYTLFETFLISVKLIRSAKYAECDANCKRATICWLLVSKQLRFPRDMRRLIGEYIWESREAVEWENPE